MMHRFYPEEVQIPYLKQFELGALGVIAAGSIYQYSSSPTSLLAIAAWNLGGRLLMRHLSNTYLEHTRFDHIFEKVWDVPVNVGVMTFLSSGVATSLTDFELGVKIAQSFSYGIVGGVIKDLSKSAANNLIPACDLKPEDKGKSIPAGKHTTDCTKYFAVQFVKFILSPLKYSSVFNVLEQSFAGFARNLTNEWVNAKDAFKDRLDQLIMGAITHPLYMVLPPMIFSSYTFLPKCSLGIVLDGLERTVYQYFGEKPFTNPLNQKEAQTKEKAL